MWHAGQGGIQSPYEAEVQSLAQRVKSAQPTGRSTFRGIDIPEGNPTPFGPAGPKNVMGQMPSTSRATPTGTLSEKMWAGLTPQEANPVLAPEEHAAMEAQAGRPLSPDEAAAMRRANIETQMGKGGGEDIGAIREQHRAGLEQKGRR